MKYLVHIRPPKEVSDLIFRYRKSLAGYLKRVSRSGPHITLMTIYASIKREKEIVKSLEELSWQEFYVKTDDLELFKVGDENSLFLRLKKNPVLTGLHLKVIEALKGYIKWGETPDFTEEESRSKVYSTYGSPYYAEFYNPHISIGLVRPEIINDSRFDASHFRSNRWTIAEFYLSSNKSHEWETVGKFFPK